MDHSQAADSQAVDRYLLDEMTDGERVEFEDHFFECDICTEELKQGALMEEAARHYVPSPVFLDRIKGWFRQPLFVAPASVAAALALMVTYQAREVALLSQAQAGVIVQVNSVLGSTPNEVPANRFAQLEVELGVVDFPRYQFELFDAANRRIFVAPVDAPQRANPLGVVIHQGLPAGKYTLRISGLNESGKAVKVKEYPIEAVKR